MKAQVTRLILLAGMMILLAGCQSPTALPTPTAAPSQTSSPPANTFKIRVTQFPPQYYQDENGRWTGLDVELARALVEKAGLVPKFVELPWSRALQDMESGDLHLMMNLSQTPERSAFMAWVGPERIARVVLVVQQENVTIPIAGLDDLPITAAQYGMKYGIQQDAFYSQEFNDRLKADLEFAAAFEMVTEARLNPPKTTNGRILGFFEDYDAVKYKLVHDPEYADLAMHTFKVSESPVYFGVSLAGVSPDIIQRLQTAYAQLEQDGTFERIRATDWK